MKTSANSWLRIALALSWFGLDGDFAWAQMHTFEENGEAIIDCQCPTPSTHLDCGGATKLEAFSARIFIKEGLAVDLADVCFKEKTDGIDDQGPLCCAMPRSDYSGKVGQIVE
ncbi:hypothetical protein [Rhizobium sp. MHM7A]|uniref:hypothetical protein n=1 Tax=Rhizobium sp. MHM7A TaxID=2583233 RepID=UPI0011061B91|nr:hypothetical protein [Rhizobium sp. MHM7A]TLX16321.1 hypothetical protein FFR93_03045 [Rhizobium sp. MHM7A]